MKIFPSSDEMNLIGLLFYRIYLMIKVTKINGLGAQTAGVSKKQN